LKGGDERGIEALIFGPHADFVAGQVSVHTDGSITTAPYEKPVTSHSYIILASIQGGGFKGFKPTSHNP
jgi:hypothetical protein